MTDPDKLTGLEPSLGDNEVPISGREPSLPGDFEVLKTILVGDLTGFPEDNEPRYARIETIRSRGVDVMPALLDLCGQTDPAIRKAAIATIGMIGDPAAVPTLMAIMQEPYSNIHQAVVIALCNIRPLPEAELLSLLLHEDPLIRQYIIRALGNVLSDAAIARLAELLKQEQNLKVLRAIATILSQRRDRRAIPLLEVLADIPDYAIRKSAVNGIIQFRDQDAVDALERVISTGSPNSRRRALEFLGRTGHPDALRVLKEALRSEDGYTRTSAVIGICEYRDPWVIPVLESLLQDPELGGKARRAIEYLQGPRTHGPPFSHHEHH